MADTKSYSGARRKLRLNFSQKLFLGIATLSILSLLVIFGVVNIIVRGIIYDNVIGIVQRDKIIYANEIDAWFSIPSQTVMNLATSLRALPSEEYFPNVAASFVVDYDFIENVFIGFADGSVINGTDWRPDPTEVGPDLGGVGWGPWERWVATDRPWFVAAVTAGGGVVATTDPYFSLSMRNITVAKGTWVPGLSDVGAAVGFSLSLDYILGKISGYQIMGGGYLILVGTHGEIIIHPDAEYAPYLDGTLRSLRGIPNGDFFMDSITAGVTLANFDDLALGPSYFIATPIEAVGWTLIAVIPSEVTQVPVFRNLALIMLVLVVIVLILFVFTAVFVLRLVKNMEEAQQREVMERKRVEAAEKSSRTKSRFLARMSHEIRTPLTAILGISEIQLQDTTLTPHTEEAFAKIHSSASTLLNIVNDILDLSKIEAGKMALANKEYASASLISDVVQLHSIYLSSRKIKFNVNVDKQLPAYLIGDELRIKQVLSNLLSNAFKYTEAGSVRLSVRCEKDSHKNRVVLIIELSDTGMGMTSEQLNAMYSEYVRFHEQNSHANRVIEGTGLGLSIVYNLVQMMNGEISVKSEVGKGTKISVRIPQEAAPCQETLGKKTVRSLQAFEVNMGTAAKRFKLAPEPMPYGRVLVVDDMDANLYVARGLLQFYDLKIETCGSGFEAIEKVKRGKVYDIIFMDQMMPGIDGTETTKTLRGMGYTHPVVALTANALIGEAEKFLRNGFDGFISKPIQTTHLNTILTKFIRDKQPPEVIETAHAEGNFSPAEGDIDDYMDRPEVAGTLRADFARSQKNAVSEISRALEAGDVKTAHRLAHTLKGLAGTIRETGLAQTAADLEKLLSQEEMGEAEMKAAQQQVSVLEKELAPVLERAKAALADSDAALPDRVFDKNETGELLDKLASALAENSAGVIALVDGLKGIPEAAVLVRQVEDFDFETASKTLASLREVLEV